MNGEISPILFWGLAGLALVLIAAAASGITALVIRRKAKSAPKPAPEAGESLSVQVGKLHAQGAREGQQDCFSVSPQDLWESHGLLAVVADGMGGLENGDQVSQTAVSAVINSFFSLPTEMEPQRQLLTLLQSANGAVNYLLGPERVGQCGSTLVAGLLKKDGFSFLSVGDSRVCLFRDGVLVQLNREHIYRRELELRAVNGEGTLEEAASHPRASGLTSYLGMGQIRGVDLPDQPVRIQPGDRFLLMSDGVYNALTSEELCGALSLDAQEAADAIGEMVESRAWPGQDNYTAVIIQYGSSKTDKVGEKHDSARGLFRCRRKRGK